MKQRIIRDRVYVFYNLHLMLLLKYGLKEALFITFKEPHKSMLKPVYKCAVLYRRSKTFINLIVTVKRSKPGFKNLLATEIVKI